MVQLFAKSVKAQKRIDLGTKWGRKELVSKVIEELKDVIDETIPEDSDILLLYGGKSMNPEKTLFDYKVPHGCTLQYHIKKKESIKYDDEAVASSTSTSAPGVPKKEEKLLSKEEIEASDAPFISSAINGVWDDDEKAYICKLSDAKSQQTTNDDMPYFFYFRFISTWKINKSESQPKPAKDSPKKGGITAFLKPKMKAYTVILDWGDIEYPKDDKGESKAEYFALLRMRPTWRDPRSSRFFHPSAQEIKVDGQRMYFTVTDDKDTDAKRQDESDVLYITFGEKSADEDEGCSVCGKNTDEENMLLCDECDGQYHGYCLNPPIENLADLPEKWYCHKCFKDPNKGKKAAKAKKPKPSELTDKNWGGGMACAGRSKECTIVSAHHYGKVPGIPTGSWWPYRVSLSESGVHRPPVGGMHGRASDGCYSIVLSGGYEDDEDNGDEFVYTGSGGRDLKGNKRSNVQSKDQALDRTNLALALNCYGHKKSCKECTAEKICESCKANWKKGKPVRVCRGGAKWGQKKKPHSQYCPPFGIRYDGVYKVVDFWPEKGKSGFIVWKYRLRRDDDEPAPWTKEGKELADRLYEEGLKIMPPREPENKKKKKKSEEGEEEEEEEEKPKSKKSKKDTKEKKDTKKSAKKSKKDKEEVEDEEEEEEEENDEENEEEEDLSGSEDFVIVKKVKKEEPKKRKAKKQEKEEEEEEEEPTKKKTKTKQEKTSTSPKPPAKVDFLTEEMKEAVKANVSHKKVWDDILYGVTTGAIPSLTKFLERVAEEFVCVVCQDVVNTPVLLECGHNYCKKPCFVFLMKTKDDCAMCHAKISKDVVKGLPVNESLMNVLKLLLPHKQ